MNKKPLKETPRHPLMSWQLEMFWREAGNVSVYRTSVDGATKEKLRNSSTATWVPPLPGGRILRIEMATLHIVTQNFYSNALRCMLASLYIFGSTSRWTSCSINRKLLILFSFHHWTVKMRRILKVKFKSFGISKLNFQQENVISFCQKSYL